MPFAKRPHDRRPLAPLALLATSFLLAGCSEETVPEQGIAHPTLVEVSPDDFLGRVRCIDAPGAMRRYVATVFDIDAFRDPEDESSEPDAGSSDCPPYDDAVFALPSSTVRRGDGHVTAMPCTQNVGFSRIVAGHRYYAEIDGYDRDDLIALAPGSRVLYDPVTFERVEPRWTASCSKCAPVKGLSYLVRRIGSCGTLEDSAPVAEALVDVSIDDALAGLACGSHAGAVERFEGPLRRNDHAPRARGERRHGDVAAPGLRSRTDRAHLGLDMSRRGDRGGDDHRDVPSARLRGCSRSASGGCALRARSRM
jgi:hypothetical protein